MVTDFALQLRPMTKHDFLLFDAIQRDAYLPLFLENKAAFLRKVELFPDGNWIVEDGPRPVAYLVCHPWVLNDLVPLNDTSLRLPPSPNCLYIHSATVILEYQRMGIGHMLCAHAKHVAHLSELTYMALVSVQDSKQFWRKVGRFHTVRPVEPAMRDKLAAYGPDAQYMVARCVWFPIESTKSPALYNSTSNKLWTINRCRGTTSHDRQQTDT